MVKQLGRPAERDSQGNIISKCLVNVTIPTKLKNFLAKNEINRSQLFTRVVTMLYCHAICPKCYSDNVTDGIMGIRCDDCEKVIKYNNCSQCKTPYQRPTVTRDNTVIEGNLVEAIKGSSEYGCQSCQK